MQYSVHICIAYFGFMQFPLAWNWFFACILFGGCKCGACSTLVGSKHATCVASAGGLCGVNGEWKRSKILAFFCWNICKCFAISLWNSVMAIPCFKIRDYSLLRVEIAHSQAVDFAKCQIVKNVCSVACCCFTACHLFSCAQVADSRINLLSMLRIINYSISAWFLIVDSLANSCW